MKKQWFFLAFSGGKTPLADVYITSAKIAAYAVIK